MIRAAATIARGAVAAAACERLAIAPVVTIRGRQVISKLRCYSCFCSMQYVGGNALNVCS